MRSFTRRGLYVNIGRSAADDLRATAAPYTGWDGFNYDAGLPRDQVKDLLLQCVRHDIRAVTTASIEPGILGLLDEVDREVPLKGRRWVLGHIELLTPRDIESIVRMGLVITPHTNRDVYKLGDVWQKKLPRERRREITPLRTLLDAGVNVGLVNEYVK